MSKETFPAHTCVHCHRSTIHWLWRLTDPAPREYEISCRECAALQDAAFTPESAIEQAIAVIHTSQFFNRADVTNDWRAL